MTNDVFQILINKNICKELHKISIYITKYKH